MQHNFNHFTGKTRPFQTPRRKKGKVKNNRKHKNKYEKFSQVKEKRWEYGLAQRVPALAYGSVHIAYCKWLYFGCDIGSGGCYSLISQKTKDVMNPITPPPITPNKAISQSCRRCDFSKCFSFSCFIISADTPGGRKSPLAMWGF